MRNLRVVTPPTCEPLTLAEVKQHLRVRHTQEDALIQTLIGTARQHLEGLDGRDGILGRALLPQALELAIDGFPWTGLIDLPKPPLIAVTGITYLDDAGATQTLSTGVYTADAHMLVGRVRRRYGQTWPSTYPEPASVKVSYQAGYGSWGASTAAQQAAVPRPIKQAVLLLIGHWYSDRTPVGATAESYAVEALLAPYRIGVI